MTEPETVVVEAMKRIADAYNELSKMGFVIDEIEEILEKSPVLDSELVILYVKAERRKQDSEQSESIPNNTTRRTRVQDLTIEAYDKEALMSLVLAEIDRRLESLEGEIASRQL